MRRHALLLALLLCAPVAGRAQDQGLRSKISQLFIFGAGSDPLFLAGSGDPNNPASLRAHGAHFIPSANAQNGSLIGFLIEAIGGSVANVPIGATSGSETFQFVNGVPLRTSTSAGPIFAERAQTMGRGRSLVGLGRSSFNFRSLRGVPMDNVQLTFTHENVDFDGCDATVGGADCGLMGVPERENDVIDLSLNLDLSVEVTTLYATYGLFDRVDVGVVLPLVNTHLRGKSNAQIVPFGGTTAAHYFGGTPPNPVLQAARDVEGSSFGIGDVALRTKVLVRESPGASLALLADARFPTGDDADLLGSGTFSARGLAILSGRVGDISPHANVGYLYRAGATQNDAVLATGGFDDEIAHGVTLAVDLVSELQVGHSKLTLPAPVEIQSPFHRIITPTTIPDIRDDIVSGSFGFKFTTSKSVTIVTNALVPLNSGGLRSNLILTGAIEYIF
ncbi:MAG: transporter [Gemmatimonadaceae bacterium]